MFQTTNQIECQKKMNRTYTRENARKSALKNIRMDHQIDDRKMFAWKVGLDVTENIG